MYGSVPVLKSIMLKVKAQLTGKIYYRVCLNLRTEKNCPSRHKCPKIDRAAFSFEEN